LTSIVDYLIVIPLDEEFSYVSDVIRKTISKHKFQVKTIGPEVYATGLVSTDADDASVVILSVGRMTEAPVQSAVEAAVRTWRPSTVILIGIAGSLEPNKVNLGDVIVPRKVFGYTEAKVQSVGGIEKIEYRHTGHVLDCYLSADARAVKFKHDALWRAACRKAGLADVSLNPRLLEPPGINGPRLHIDNNDCIASGNIVVASKSFAKHVRDVLGETVKAVEMEAKGMCEALAKVRPAPPALVIRGISDYADEDKSALEKDFKDGWRRYAAQNAARFMREMIRQRPTISTGYRAVVRPSYPMTAHPESALLCLGARVTAREGGIKNVAFSPFLKCEDGFPRTQLKFEVYCSDGAACKFIEILLRATDDQRILIQNRNISSVECVVERSGEPPALELLVGLPVDAVEIRIKETDLDFHRTFEHVWHA
jgi:nucleoside phosphorylase